MSVINYTVQGMTCDHCARAITAEVGRLAGVTDVEVNVPGGRLTVTATEPVDDTAVREAVEEAGYDLVGRA